MRWMPNWRWLGRRASPPPHEADPADLGTAFGMEASLEDGGDWHPSLPKELESERQPARPHWPQRARDKH